MAILIAVAVAIFIAALEALTKIIVVIGRVNIHAVITVIRVLIGIRALVAVRPAVLPCCLPGAVALRIPVVHGLPKRIRTVLIRFIVGAAAIVTIDRGRIVVGIVVVVVILVLLESCLLPTQARQVLLLVAVTCHVVLLL